MSDHFGQIPISSSRKSHHKPSLKKSGRPSYLLSSKVGKLFFKLLLSAGIFFGIYCIGTIFLVPALVKSQLPNLLFQQPSFNTSIDKATFNPLSNELRLKNVTISFKEKNAITKELLSLKTLNITLSIPALIRNGLACKSIQIAQPVLSITRYKDKSYNISSLLKGNNRVNTGEIIEFAELPFLFSLNNISITDGKIIYHDQLTADTHTIKDITLTLPTISNFDYSTKTAVIPSFSANINGSPIHLSSTTPPTPSSIGTTPKSLGFDITSLELSRYSQYLPTSLPIKIPEGLANGKLWLVFGANTEKGNTFLAHFDIQLQNLHIKTVDELISLKSKLAIFKGSFSPFIQNITFSSIQLNSPKMITDENISIQDFTDVFSTKSSNEEKLATPLKSSLVFIKRLTVDNGALLQQKSNGDTLSQIHSLQVNIKNFSQGTIDQNTNQSDKGSFYITGIPNNSSAFLSWKGAFGENNILNGKLSLSKLPIASLLPNTSLNLQFEGAMDIQGILNFSPSSTSDNSSGFNFTDGVATIEDLSISSDQKKWLHATKAKISPLVYSGLQSALGTLVIENGTLNLYGKEVHLFIDSIQKLDGLSLQSIDFSGSVFLKPKSSSQGLELTNTRFQLTSLNHKTTKEENFAATATINNSGNLQSKGVINLAPFSAHLNIGFLDIGFNHLFSLISNDHLVDTVSGSLSGKGEYTYPDNTFSGIIQCKESTIKTLTPNSYIYTNEAIFKDLKASLFPLAFSSSHVSFTDFKLNYQDDDIITFHKGISESFKYRDQPRLVSSQNTTLENPAFLITQTKTTPPLFKNIQNFLDKSLLGKSDIELSPQTLSFNFPSITLTGGDIRYNDSRLKPPWKIKIIQLEGSINNFSNTAPQQETSYDINGIIGSYPISFNGTTSLSAHPFQARSVLKTSAFPLASFGGQLPKVLDIQRSGTFNLIMESIWAQGVETGKAQYHFSNVFPNSYESTLSLTLSILKDKNNNFQLDVPLHNYVEDPQRSLFATTVNYFNKINIKTSVEPLLLMASSYSDLIDNKDIPFEIGTDRLTETAKEKLLKYKKLLVEHPQLHLKLTGIADKTHDRAALQLVFDKEEEARIANINQQRETELKRQKNKLTLSETNGKIVEKELPTDDLNGFTPLTPKPVEVKNSDLENLAAKRVERVIEYMVHTLGIPQSQKPLKNKVVITDEQTESKRVTVSLESVRPNELQPMDSEIHTPHP